MMCEYINELEARGEARGEANGEKKGEAKLYKEFHIVNCW